MKKIILLMLFASIVLPVFSQSNFTISGYVKDSATGEELIGATVSIKELTATGTSTNAYGFYSITIPQGSYTVTAQLLGYAAKTVHVDLKANTKLDFTISQGGTQLNEVSVSGEKKNDNITNTEIGVEKVDIKEINSIPVLFGEKDILKTIQLLPGIESAGDGNSGFYVRGGSADQNLILLDEAPVYNASHLLGFFSVFNSDAIKDVTIYKGGMPAEYGGRLASVLDIKMNDGDNQKFKVSGGIGLISSRISVEGPIKKNKGSFIICARRTYLDEFLKLSSDSLLRQTQIYFYDINVKANYQLGDKDRLYLSGYFGKDVLGLGTTFGINWGNITGTLRWNHLFSDKLFCNTSFIVSNYNDNISINFSGTSIGILSRIQDYGLKEDFEYFLNSKNKIKFGFSSTYHEIVPGTITAVNSSTSNDIALTDKYAWENALYASHEIKASQRITINYGLRLTAFSLIGPGTFKTYNEATGAAIDSNVYNSAQIVKTYLNLEPRVAATYLLNEKSSVKVSYDRNVQNMHLLSNSTTTSPTDLWIPSSTYVQPEIADQFSAGYFRNFHNNDYEFSAEVYYKIIQNALDYRDNAQLNFNENVESQLLFGQGRDYGIEFFLKKKYGRFNGWIGYTLSKAEIQIPYINNGSWYPSTQDRPNDISVVGIYQLSKKVTLSATFTYYTGSPVTFPSGKYDVDGNVYFYYTSRNGYRMPDYNRMDVGLTWQRKKTEKFESSWNFSIYNVYDRWNAYTITFQTNPSNSQETQAVLTALFGIVPSISYNFKF
jgi:hypothetical protein